MEYYYIEYGFFLLAIIITFVAQIGINLTYSKYKEINGSGITGASAARLILDHHHLSDVTINKIPGTLTDYYNPSNKSLSLSADIYNGTSIASVAVAAHECGHAIQDKQNYLPMRIRAFLVPIVNFVSYASYLVLIFSLIFSAIDYINIAIIALLITLLFQLVTLPVEFDASKRAIKALKEDQLINDSEEAGTKKVLRAAAMTYVASMLSTLLNLLRFMAYSRDRDHN